MGLGDLPMMLIATLCHFTGVACPESRLPAEAAWYEYYACHRNLYIEAAAAGEIVLSSPTPLGIGYDEEGAILAAEMAGVVYTPVEAEHRSPTVGDGDGVQAVTVVERSDRRLRWVHSPRGIGPVDLVVEDTLERGEDGHAEWRETLLWLDTRRRERPGARVPADRKRWPPALRDLFPDAAALIVDEVRRWQCVRLPDRTVWEATVHAYWSMARRAPEEAKFRPGSRPVGEQ